MGNKCIAAAAGTRIARRLPTSSQLPFPRKSIDPTVEHDLRGHAVSLITPFKLKLNQRFAKHVVLR